MKSVYKFKKLVAKFLVVALILTSNSFFVCANSLDSNKNENSGYEEVSSEENLEKAEDSKDESLQPEELIGEKVEDELELDQQNEEEKEKELADDNSSYGKDEDENETETESETESLTDESVAEDETKQEFDKKEDIATQSEATDDIEDAEEVEEKSEEYKELVDEISATPSDAEEVDNKETFGTGESSLASHDSSWAEVDATGLKTAISEGKRKSVYLSEDVTFDSMLMMPGLGDITVCLHGHSVTMTEDFRVSGWSNASVLFVNCDNENKANVNISFSKNTSNTASKKNGKLSFSNVNIVSDKFLHLENMSIGFINSTFDIKSNDEVFINAINSNVEIANMNIEEKTAGFVFDNSKVVFDTVSMTNNTVDTLVKATNKSEVTIKGKSIYEGNKNIYYIENSKLNVINGSGYAKDVLREKANEEYTNHTVTKKGTKLLDPDYNRMDIVYKRNSGSYVLGVKNAEVEFDGVIIANEFTGNENTMGAYVNLGSETSKLTLLNRAYVNQNTINIVATANDEFYGSKQKSDGTYDMLDRDATLSFYPKANGLTLLRDVIKRDENSNILHARDYKTDDEWHFIVEAFFYKVCMIQNYTDDTYKRERLPYGDDVVVCEIEDIGKGEQKGTFVLRMREERENKIRFHLGEGIVNYLSWKPGEWDMTGTIDLPYIPSWKDYSQYSIEFKENFNEVQPKWVDNTIPNEPYEYTFRGWSTTKDNLIVPMGSRKDESIGYLEKGVDSILDKFGKYDYFDVLDLYACWWGDLKITYVFKAEERQLDTENPLKIEKWTEKRIIGRSNHNFTLPTYVKGEDYIYDHFTVVGWQKHSYEDKNVDYTITWLGPKWAQGDVVVEEHNTSHIDYELKEVHYYALFEGDSYKVNWYLESEGIKEVVSNTLKAGMITEGENKGFYQNEVKFGDTYSRINPVIDISFLSNVYTNFTLNSGVEFLGWTKEEIKKPLTDEELYEEVEVDDGEKKTKEKKLKVTLVKDFLMGYSTIGDSYYYPVLHYTPDVAEHLGNIALTQSYIDTQALLGGVNVVEVSGELISGSDIYELTTDLKLQRQIEIVGDVTIDLHGHELYLDGGAYFYGDGNLTFTDCKHDEVKPNDRGSIYNDNGMVYKGSGNLKFYRMTFRGKQAYRFESLDKEVIIDDVELREEEFNQLFTDPYADRYPRLMQIDNASVHIMNTTMDNIDGKIVVMNGGHLELTNFTMINCRRPEKNLDELEHIVAQSGSSITVNTPCWFENNADIFTLYDSYLEIKSDFGKISSLEELDENEVFTGDCDAIKDRAVIFTKNVYESIIKVCRSEVRISGIFYKNKTRLPIVTDRGGDGVVHFNGYIYVKENTDSVNDYSDMGMFGDIRYIQEDGDFLNPYSEMDYYTFYWSSHFRCDPYACREYKILENLSAEEMEGLNLNRFTEGVRKGQLKTFTLKNEQNGYNENYYRPIIDGINYDEEKGRGYEVVFNYENELSIIDINFKNESSWEYVKFRDMDGNLVDNAVIQFDKRTPESRQKFIDWWNSLEFISNEKRYEYDGMYRQNPVSHSEYPISLDMILRATASMRIILKTKRTQDYVFDEYSVFYDINAPKKIDGTHYNGYKDPASGTVLINPEILSDDNDGNEYKTNDWYEIKGVKYSDNAENIYPFTFVGWEYTDGDDTYLFKQGEKYQLGKDFPRYYGKSFRLKGKWKAKEVNVVYKLNKYVKFKGITEDYVERVKVGEYADILDIRSMEIDNRFVFTGWYMKEPAKPGAQWASLDGVKWMVNNMELPDNMLPDGRYASQHIQQHNKLGSKLYIEEYKKDLFAYTNSLYDITSWQEDYNKDYVIYPIYYPKDNETKKWVLEELTAYYEAAKLATQSDAYKTMTDSHCNYDSTFYYFYRNNKTISKNVSIGEDVELTSDITIDGDVTLDLHGYRFVVTTGKFIIPEGSSLTINNCKAYGGFAFGDNTISEGEGQIKLDNIYIHDIDNTIVFDNNNVYMTRVKMNDIKVNSGNLFEIKNDAKVKFDKMSFDGLKSGFDIDNSYFVLSGVSVKNSTVDVLFNVHNKAKVDVSKYSNKEKVDYVNSIFENNKNIALVDDSQFMVTGSEDIDEDSQKDTFVSNRKDTRNPWIIKDYSNVTVEDIYKADKFYDNSITPLGIHSNYYDNRLIENKIKRVLFRNNKGNYVFGAKNNAEIFFNGIAINNQLTADANGKMGAYVNLGGQNKLVLRNTPYINQNSRNIVVTDDDFITCDTNEPEYQHGRTLSKNATLSFYITEHKTTRMFVGTDESWKVEDGENPFGTDIYNVTVGTDDAKYNYMQPSCMIEGYRDSLFKFYGEDYAGTKMTLEFRQDEEDPTIKGFYAVPDDTKDIIKIKLVANSGVLFSVDENGNPITYYDTDEEGNITKVYSCVNEDGTIRTDLKDAKGNKDRERLTPKVVADERFEIVTEYEFDYPRFKAEHDWWDVFLSSVSPVKVEKTEVDEYYGEFRGWLYTPEHNSEDGIIRYLGTYDIVDNTQDVVVFAQFYFAPLAKVTFTPEKGGAEDLRGIAYEVATESVVTEYSTQFRLETYGITGDIDAPAYDVLTITPINGWKMGAQWIAEDNPSQPKITPGVAQAYTTTNKDAHYYIEWIDPGKKPEPERPVYTRPTTNNNRGNTGGSSGGSGGSGGGSAISQTAQTNTPALNQTSEPKSLFDIIINAMNPQANQNAQQNATNADSRMALAFGPSADNPFVAKASLNQQGEVVVQTNEQVGKEQFDKAVSIMQAAVVNANLGISDKANVSQVSLNANDVKWEKALDGSWTISASSLGTNGDIKNAWQPIVDANGTSSWYKFDGEGKMQTGWVVDDNKVYYMLESGQNQGAMVKGVSINIGGYVFSFDNTGALVNLGAAQ